MRNKSRTECFLFSAKAFAVYNAFAQNLSNEVRPFRLEPDFFVIFTSEISLMGCGPCRSFLLT